MKAVFLDRDGVINRYPGDKKYVSNLKEFRFLPRVKKALALLRKNAYSVFIISNQAGVGKGLYSQKTLDTITQHMCQAVEASAGRITKVYYCTHRQEKNCACRKPKPGMIALAKKEYHLNLSKVFFIGDTIRDVVTANAAGCPSILVFSGKEKLANRPNWEVRPDYWFKDLYSAVKFILKR